MPEQINTVDYIMGCIEAHDRLKLQYDAWVEWAKYSEEIEASPPASEEQHLIENWQRDVRANHKITYKFWKSVERLRQRYADLTRPLMFESDPTIGMLLAKVRRLIAPGNDSFLPQ